MSVRLADLTTLRVGGRAAEYHAAKTTDELVAIVAEVDSAGRELLVVGGGSNLLVGDDDVPATVVHVRTTGLELLPGVAVAAGEPWDDVVAAAVANGWSGVEALSGIPGSAGATPVQNVGAYGQEVADTLVSVHVWDRAESRRSVLAAADCAFAYRDSLFKRERFRGGPRFVVLEVVLDLPVSELSAPVRYAELAGRLGVDAGERASTERVRETVLTLRRGKGMVLDDADHDTWSAGSFFTNPIVETAALQRIPEKAPRWSMPDGRVKLSAAWLIERAGFGKGHGLPGPASLSTKHTLALTHRGTARAADVLALAREVRDGVRSVFGVELVPEPVLVGCAL